jgi:hypothetical protein
MSAPPTGVLFYEGRAKPLSTIGLTQPGAYYLFYSTNTLTPAIVYADGDLTVPLSQNPGNGGTTAASDGRLLPIYLDPSVVYRYQLYSRSGILLEDIDPYLPVSIPSQALIGAVLYPQTPQETSASITPVNYQYSPDHIGDDVRRYGNIDLTGAVDSQFILSEANSVGVALYLPKGTYRISSNITFSVPLYFEFGAILKPDAGVTITINSPVWAGPWQIFNVINTNALITGLIRPMTYGVRIPVEWMGAVGDNATNDTAAFAATAALAKAAGNIGIQLQAKTYFINSTIYGNGSGSAGQSFYSPSWFGVEKRQTIISCRGAPAGTPALLFQGGSGQNCGATIQDIGFSGDSNSIGISFEGQNGMRAIRCLFDTNACGVRFYNNQVGSFTEFCVAEQCEFTALCITDAQFARNLGNASLHGSGLLRCLSNKSGGNSVLIGAGVAPYNAPLDLQIWNNGATTLVNNSSSSNVWFHGNLTFETLSGVLTLASTNPVYYSGTITGDNELVTGGALIQCEAFQSNLSGAPCALGIRKAYSQVGVSGTNSLVSSVPGGTKLIDVRITATNYDWRGTFVITHNGSGSAGYIYAIGTTLVNNTAAFGAPSASVDNTGNLLLVNSSYSSSVSIRWAEKDFGFGIINGAVATF